MTTKYATVRRATNAVIGKGDGNTLRAPGARTIELTASASGTIVDFKLRLPTSARIDMLSKLYWDDLATSGSPTLDMGLYAVDSNVTSDADALNDGLALSAASTGSAVIKDAANAGKQLWEFVSGLTADPGGFLDVKGVVKDAATTATGTVTLDIKTYDD